MRSHRFVLPGVCLLMAAVTVLAGKTSSRVIWGPDGLLIATVETGERRPVRRPDGSAVRGGAELLSARSLQVAAGAPMGGCTQGSIGCRTTAHEDPVRGVTVFPDGTVRATGSLSGGGNEPVVESVSPTGASVAAATIDRMTTSVYYYETFSPGGLFNIAGWPDTYHLSDGTQWDSGAGSFRAGLGSFHHVEVSGSELRFILSEPADGILMEYTDFDGGYHSSAGRLGVVGPLVIEAVMGQQTAVLRGQAEILANPPTHYGDLFNLYSAPVGAVVPFEVTYRLVSGGWSMSTFSATFSYSLTGTIDFANPVSVPLIASLEIKGSSQVPSSSSVPFAAVVTYDNGVLKTVTGGAVWSVEPSRLATIDAGVLTTFSLPSGPEPLTLHATYEENGLIVEASKTVLCVPGGSADLPQSWEMYQADSSHTGALPVSVQPEIAALRWQRTLAPGIPLNPVTAADGRVFVSLTSGFSSNPSFFTLDALDGATLWSRQYNRPFSVNPPSYAYGNVYIQTGNHGSDTWLRAYDAASGNVVFESPHAAQWERYFAPTIFDGVVYINGGYYGGMYAFDAFSGEQLWFRALAQYDEWTPAVDANHAYAYAGSTFSVVDRRTGIVVRATADPHFVWQGYDMRLAPVLGSANNALVIQGGRLVSFDTLSRSIHWELTGGYAGQPSVARGSIFAIRNGGLVVLDEATGAPLWSWAPPTGSLTGAVIVTDTHLFASTGAVTHAVDLFTRAHVWSYPAGGHLALSEDTLYVASSQGTLTAISLPSYTPARLTRLEVAGPTQVVEGTSVQFSALAYFDDGRVRNRTLQAEWSIEPDDWASIDPHGTLAAEVLISPAEHLVVRARYTERGVTADGEQPVELVIGVSVTDLIRRNLGSARDLRTEALTLFQEADVREEASRLILQERQQQLSQISLSAESGEVLALIHLIQAQNWSRMSVHGLTQNLLELQAALDALGSAVGPIPSSLRDVEDPE